MHTAYEWMLPVSQRSVMPLTGLFCFAATLSCDFSEFYSSSDNIQRQSHLPFHVCVALYLVPSKQLYSKAYCDLHVMRCSIWWFIMFEMRMLLLLFQLWIFCVKYRSERRSSVSLGLSWGMHHFYRAGRHSLLIFPSFRPDCSDSAAAAVKIL
jgi:hypothetical protein